MTEQERSCLVMKEFIKYLIAAGIGVVGYKLIYSKGYNDAIKTGSVLTEFEEHVLNEANKES